MIDLRPSTTQQRLAVVLVVGVVLLTAAAQRHLNQILRVQPWVGTWYGLLVGTLDIAAGCVLALRFRLAPYGTSSSLIGIAVSCGVLDITFGLLLPGALGQPHPLNTSTHVAAYCWLWARCVWAGGTAVYVWRYLHPKVSYRPQWSVLAGIALGLVSTGVIIAVDSWKTLPSAQPASTDLVVVLLLATTVSLLTATRARTLGQLYLLVAGFCSICEALLLAETPLRYTVAWYGARAIGVLEAIAFFAALTVQSWPLIAQRGEGADAQPDYRSG